MNRILCCGLVVGLAALLTLRATAERDKPKDTAAGNIGHMVYFSLKDNSADAKQKLVDACKKHLGDHEPNTVRPNIDRGDPHSGGGGIGSWWGVGHAEIGFQMSHAEAQGSRRREHESSLIRANPFISVD